MRTFPNPVDKSLDLSFYSPSKSIGKIIVKNNSNEIVSETSKELGPGDNGIKIVTDILPDGIYILEITSEDRGIKIKFSVAHQGQVA
ncbi:MAG: hypothetical protein JWO32_823 [Bacteroidetes bacterium]|nr:hypothetical protein [Bacteroidota bacterium]